MSRDEATGRFLPGNRFWEARSSAGPKPKFTDPDALWSACVEYFEWVESNPLYEDKLVTFQGAATHEPVAKMRAMTIGGLCLFLDIDETTWRAWKDSRPDLSTIIVRVERVIYHQKFSGAAADLLNPNIIARDLGLADKSEHSGPNGGPIQTEEVSARDRIAGKLAGLAAREDQAGDTGEPE
ncbi:DNA-packaging protein [Mameliella alba]|uniref:DNA-packaging protein n=1 Tax=Mameliella alba TaxID=561184 RepID=UPI000B533EC4|nr:DNA-packaging protein [Mameliella alba]OWV44216.1 terminase small subunit [Mameliella alba]